MLPRPDPTARTQRLAACSLVVSVCALAFLLVTTVSWGDALGVTALLVFFVVFWGRLHRRYPKRILQLVLLAFTLRALAALVQAFVTNLPDSTSDAMSYETAGWILSQQGLSSVLASLTQWGESVFSSLIGLIYWAVGTRSPLLIQAINVAVGTLVVLNVFKIAKLLGGSRAAERATIVAALFPTLILYSALTLREAPIAYFASYAVLFLLRWVATGKNAYVLVAALASVVGALFHSGVLVVVAALSLVVLITDPGRLRSMRGGSNAGGRFGAGGPVQARSLFGQRVVMAAVLVGVLAAVALFSIGTQKFQTRYLDFIMSAQFAHGGAQYLSGWSANSYLGWVIQIPVRAVYFVASPFPWQIRSSNQLVGLVDSLLYVGAVVLLVRYLGYVWRNPRFRAVAVPAALMTGLFAAGTSNFGTAIRHRTKVAPLLIALAMALLEVRRQRRDSLSASLRGVAGSPPSSTGPPIQVSST